MMKKLMLLLLAVLLLSGTAAAEGNYLIVCPEGAPALAVASLKDHVQTIDAATIAAPFSSEEADFIIAPVNAGAKLFKAGKSTYRLAAVVTWGNLVFASQIPDFTLESMNGKEVTLFGENTINASVALYILKEKGITPSGVTYLAGAKQTQELLVNQADAVVMTAEPAATAAWMANNGITAISLTDLFRDLTGDEGYVQAGLFVREKTLQENAGQVDAWLAEIRASADLCETDPEAAAAAAVGMEILNNEKVALRAIPNCHIHYVPASEVKELVEKTAAIDLSQFGGEAPADDFYYESK